MKGTVPLLFAIIFSLIEGDISYGYQANESEICSQIGIEENAVLNECGFCTEGDTGLDANYGFDCNHICNGQSYLDCNNQCNGNSFIDVCTGTCIKPSDNLTIYDNRDCTGICLNSLIDSNQYIRNDCDQCQLVCGEGEGQYCKTDCDFNEVTESTVVCDNDIEDTYRESESDNSCYECKPNDTIGCSCRLNPVLCGCNSSKNCYYMASIDPNVVPTNTPIDIIVSGFFNGVARLFQCVLTNQREGNKFLFEAKLLNSSSIECNINLTQAGLYIFGLQSNDSDNVFNISVYDNDLVFFSDMNPKKILTTTFKDSIDLMFDFQNEINFNFIALLKCKIIYDSKQMIVRSNNGNSCSIPSSEIHSESQEIVVIPTFDGIHSVSNPNNFSLTLISPFPHFEDKLSFISEDGLNIIVGFERPIDIFVPKTMFAQEVCDHYFTNTTLNRLKSFGLIHCKWLTTTQLSISLSYPIDVHFIDISIKQLTIKEFGQSISETNDKVMELSVKKRKAIHHFYDSDQQLELRGPTLLPLCGPFSLNAYFYSPKGSTNVVFKWSVTTLPLRNNLISDKLFETIDSNNKTSLLLFGEMFSLESISYKFTISALFEDQTIIESSHQILRSSEQLPIVTIYSSPQPNQHRLISHKSQSLYSEVLIPTCISIPEPLTFSWKTNNAETKFNFENMTSPDYQIDYSKHTNQMTTYEITVQMGNKSSITSTASLTIYPIPSQRIIDISDHKPMHSIGQKSGKFKLSAPLLYSENSNSTGYLWTCTYSDSQQPCANSFNTKQLLISKNIQNRRDLFLNSESMKISEHKFRLQVMDTKDNSSQLFNPFTIVKVFEGNAPQVFIDSVYVRVDDNNIDLIFNNNQSNVISVPSKTHLMIKGVVKKSIQFDSIEWHLSQSIFKLSWSNTITKNGIISELHLYPDQILPFGSYNISLKACNGDGVCSQVKRQLIAGPVVNQCVLRIESNQMMSEIAFITDRCNAPMTRLPLTYQLFVTNANNRMTALTKPQFSSVIVIDSSQLIPSGKTYSIELCDGYAFCQMINTNNGLVLESTKFQNNSQTIDEIIERSQKYISFDPISALILLMSPMTNISEQNSINSLKFEILSKISPEKIKRRGELILIYDTFSHLFKDTKDFKIKSNLIQNIKQISENTRISVDIHTLDTLYTNLMNFYTYENKVYQQINDSYGYFIPIDETQKQTYFLNIRQILVNILKSCAKQIPIGKYVKLGTRVVLPKAVTLITHQKRFHEIQLTTKFNETKNVSVWVKFNEQIISKYMNRILQNSQNIIHNSVVYALTLFPNQSPYTYGNEMHKLSPIVDISVHSPISGQRMDTEFRVQKPKKKDDKYMYDFIVLMKVSLTGNETFGGSSYLTKCNFFTEKYNNWEMDGITELGISGRINHRIGGCFMGHLSSVAIFRVVNHITSDYVFAIFVLILMGVLIFGIMVVFFVQKKEETVKMKVNDKHQSFSNSHKNSFDDNYTKTYVY